MSCFSVHKCNAPMHFIFSHACYDFGLFQAETYSPICVSVSSDS